MTQLIKILEMNPAYPMIVTHGRAVNFACVEFATPELKIIETILANDAIKIATI